MWSIHDARNRFSALVEAAQRGEPQVVTKRGAPAVVVLAVEQYARLKGLEQQRTPSFINHLLTMPQDDKRFNRLEIEPRP
jgi:antitoxin Phd